METIKYNDKEYKMPFDADYTDKKMIALKKRSWLRIDLVVNQL